MGKVVMGGIVPPLEKPVGGTQIADVAVGSVLKLNVNGAPAEFIVIHQGNPDPSIYDESCDGTWLMAKDIYENRVWDSTDNDYKNSDIHAYLNGDFFDQLDEDLQSVIKEVKIPYRKGSGYSTGVTKGANGLSTKVFLLSATEVGFNASYLPSGEGAELSYFSGCADNAADDKRIAYLNGSANVWWLRSPYCNIDFGSVRSVGVITNGFWGLDYCSDLFGIRPVFIVPSDVVVDGNGNIIV